MWVGETMVDVLVCWYASTLLCVFTFLIHTRTFFPTPPAPPARPHLSCGTSVSGEGPQAASPPSFFTPSLLFPPPRLAGSVYVFPACFMFFLLLPEREHAPVRVALVPSGLCWESLSSFFKSHQQNSPLKMQKVPCVGASGSRC